MATLRMAALWKDPRNNILVLRKHIQAVSGHRGNTIKISTGSADPKEAERRLPDMLKRWVEMQAEWERKLSVGALTFVVSITSGLVASHAIGPNAASLF
jgi:hypothetical protein